MYVTALFQLDLILLRTVDPGGRALAVRGGHVCGLP